MSRAPAATRDLEIEGRHLRVTNTDRVLWPGTGFTKGDLIDYYSAVAPALLPHLVDRPVTLGRWPHGVDARGFAQSECRGQPEWMRGAELRLRSGEVRRHCLIDDAASLVWVANLAAIELHTYQFQFEHPDQPTAALLDLDPGPEVSVPELAEAALIVRDELAALGLKACVKTSGSAGLHVHVPLGRAHPADVVNAFVRKLAADLAAAHGHLITDDPRLERAKRVRLDWRQAQARRLIVAPYSLRATDEPAVSTPISFEEVAEAQRGRALQFGPADVLERVRTEGDLFAPMLTTTQSLPVEGTPTT